MELVSYDEIAKTSTVALTDVELVDLNELLTGVLATKQDYTILGVQKERLKQINDELYRLLQERFSDRKG